MIRFERIESGSHVVGIHCSRPTLRWKNFIDL